MNTPTNKPAPESARPMQVPPIDAESSVLLRFHSAPDPASLAPIVMVATGTNQNVQPQYSVNAEYWSVLAGALSQYAQLFMTLDSQPYTASQLGGVFNDYTARLEVGEKALALQWIKGVVAVPTDSLCTLFKARDPDDPERWIGLLLEQGPDFRLRHVSWYKTWDPPGGNVWSAAAAPLGKVLSWSAVLDSQGNPSILPSSIDPEASWYSFTV